MTATTTNNNTNHSSTFSSVLFAGGKKRLDLELSDYIASGSFGSVHEARCLEYGKCAVKLIPVAFIREHKIESYILREIELTKNLRHPNIVRTFDATLVNFDTKFIQKNPFADRDPNTQGECLAILMEQVTGGDVFERVLKTRRFEQNLARHLFQQLVAALIHLHSHHYVHRDLKAENLLLTSTQGTPELKLCDFGLARKVVSDSEIDKLTGEQKAILLRTLAGSIDYQSPEVLDENGGYVGFTCDVWSAAIVLYFMLCGTFPFHADSDEEITRRIMSGKFEDAPHLPPAAAEMIRGMLIVDISKRWTFYEVVRHPWFQNGLAKKVLDDLERKAKAIYKSDRFSPQNSALLLNEYLSRNNNNNDSQKLKENDVKDESNHDKFTIQDDDEDEIDQQNEAEESEEEDNEERIASGSSSNLQTPSSSPRKNNNDDDEGDEEQKKPTIIILPVAVVAKMQNNNDEHDVEELDTPPNKYISVRASKSPQKNQPEENNTSFARNDFLANDENDNNNQLPDFSNFGTEEETLEGKHDQVEETIAQEGNDDGENHAARPVSRFEKYDADDDEEKTELILEQAQNAEFKEIHVEKNLEEMATVHESKQNERDNDDDAVEELDTPPNAYIEKQGQNQQQENHENENEGETSSLQELDTPKQAHIVPEQQREPEIITCDEKKEDDVDDAIELVDTPQNEQERRLSQPEIQNDIETVDEPKQKIIEMPNENENNNEEKQEKRIDDEKSLQELDTTPPNEQNHENSAKSVDAVAVVASEKEIEETPIPQEAQQQQPENKEKSAESSVQELDTPPRNDIAVLEAEKLQEDVSPIVNEFREESSTEQSHRHRNLEHPTTGNGKNPDETFHVDDDDDHHQQQENDNTFALTPEKLAENKNESTPEEQAIEPEEQQKQQNHDQVTLVKLPAPEQIELLQSIGRAYVTRLELFSLHEFIAIQEPSIRESIEIEQNAEFQSHIMTLFYIELESIFQLHFAKLKNQESLHRINFEIEEICEVAFMDEFRILIVEGQHKYECIDKCRRQTLEKFPFLHTYTLQFEEIQGRNSLLVEESISFQVRDISEPFQRFALIESNEHPIRQELRRYAKEVMRVQKIVEATWKDERLERGKLMSIQSFWLDQIFGDFVAAELRICGHRWANERKYLVAENTRVKTQGEITKEKNRNHTGANDDDMDDEELDEVSTPSHHSSSQNNNNKTKLVDFATFDNNHTESQQETHESGYFFKLHELLSNFYVDDVMNTICTEYYINVLESQIRSEIMKEEDWIWEGTIAGPTRGMSMDFFSALMAHGDLIPEEEEDANNNNNNNDGEKDEELSAAADSTSSSSSVHEEEDAEEKIVEQQIQQQLLSTLSNNINNNDQKLSSPQQGRSRSSTTTKKPILAVATDMQRVAIECDEMRERVEFFIEAPRRGKIEIKWARILEHDIVAARDIGTLQLKEFESRKQLSQQTRQMHSYALSEVGLSLCESYNEFDVYATGYFARMLRVLIQMEKEERALIERTVAQDFSIQRFAAEHQERTLRESIIAAGEVGFIGAFLIARRAEMRERLWEHQQRVEWRKLIDDELLERDCVEMFLALRSIQSAGRAFRVRCRLGAANAVHRRAAKTLQRVGRGWLARSRLVAEAIHERERERLAVYELRSRNTGIATEVTERQRLEFFIAASLSKYWHICGVREQEKRKRARERLVDKKRKEIEQAQQQNQIQQSKRNNNNNNNNNINSSPVVEILRNDDEEEEDDEDDAVDQSKSRNNNTRNVSTNNKSEDIFLDSYHGGSTSHSSQPNNHYPNASSISTTAKDAKSKSILAPHPPPSFAKNNIANRPQSAKGINSQQQQQQATRPTTSARPTSAVKRDFPKFSDASTNFSVTRENGKNQRPSSAASTLGVPSPKPPQQQQEQQTPTSSSFSRRSMLENAGRPEWRCASMYPSSKALPPWMGAAWGKQGESGMF